MERNNKIRRLIQKIAVFLAVILAFPQTALAQGIGLGTVPVKAEEDVYFTANEMLPFNPDEEYPYIGLTLTANCEGIANPGYQWMLDGEEITGANSQVYTTTEDDFGKILSVKVIDSNNSSVTKTASAGKVKAYPFIYATCIYVAPNEIAIDCTVERSEEYESIEVNPTGSIMLSYAVCDDDKDIDSLDWENISTINIDTVSTYTRYIWSKLPKEIIGKEIWIRPVYLGDDNFVEAETDRFRISVIVPEIEGVISVTKDNGNKYNSGIKLNNPHDSGNYYYLISETGVGSSIALQEEVLDKINNNSGLNGTFVGYNSYDANDTQEGIDNITFSMDCSNLEDGNYELQVLTEENIEDITYLSKIYESSFCIDNTAPVITGAENNTTYNGEVTVSINDKNLSSVTIRKDTDEQATSLTISDTTIDNNPTKTATQTVTELGTYTVTATDSAGNTSTCSFTIAQEDVVITAKTDTTITYAPSATFDVSGLFTIPANAGTATYSVVSDEAEGAGAGTLGEDGKTLTITKAGTITIEVRTAGSTYAAPSEKTAVLTVSKSTLNNTMLSLNRSAFDYIVGTTYTPVLTVKDGNSVLALDTDYEIVTAESTISADAVGTYTIKVNGKGNYTGSASITWKIEKTDNTAPVITGVENDTTYNGEVTVSINDKNLSSVTIREDNDEQATSLTISDTTIDNNPTKTATQTVTELCTYTVTATDSAGNTSTCSFTIAQGEVIITAKTDEADTTITYAPSATFDVSGLFTIPANAGTATYSVVSDEAEGAGAGTLGEDGKTLTITKAGPITIEVRTAGSTYAAPSEKTNILTVAKAKGDLNVGIKDVVYGENIDLSVNSTTYTGKYTVEYTGRGTTAYTATSKAPTEAGTYTVTVTYSGNNLYDKAVKSVDFKITPATLTVTANNVSKKEQEIDPELTYTVDGLKYNDSKTDVLSGTIAREQGEEAGEYSIVQSTLTANKNYTILFKGATFTITSKPVYDISVDKSDETSGIVSGTGSYEEGATVTLTAIANNGYKFVEWQENGNSVETTSTYEFAALSDRKLVAVFTEKEELTLTISAVSGNVGDSNVGNITLTGNTEKGNVLIEYFIDESCITKTNTINGAKTEGGVPKNIGTYYVKATVAETDNYKSKSVLTSFTINQINNNSDSGSGSGSGSDNNIVKSSGLSLDTLANIKLYVKDNVGTTKIVTASLSPENVTDKNIVWSVTKTGIVSLSSYNSTSGTPINITAIKPGTVNIVAKAADNSNVINIFTVNVVDIYYAPKVNWTNEFPSNFSKGSASPILKYKVTYTSSYTGETVTTDEISVKATTTDNSTAGSPDKEVNFIAVADLSGYFADKEGTASVVNVELSKTYRFREGSDDSITGSQSGRSVSEPEGSVAYNLFYTDTEIRIPLPEGVDTSKADANAKWAKFYKVESDGTVTVTGDRKKAASAANSLIVLPVFDGETRVGQFSYQLATSYVKPKLSLSSKSAIIKKGEEQTVATTVLEKKSNGLLEAIDVTNQAEGVSYWNGKGSVTVAEGDEAGQLLLTTTDAASGKIVIKQENWNEQIELKYSIKAKNDDVLSASATTVTMNSNATAGDDLAVEIKLNNKEIDSESGVTVTMPKGWDSANIDIEGIEDGKLVSSELKFSYKEGAPKKGNYTFKFTKGKAKVSVKLAVSNAALDKAVTLKVKTKLDLVSGQKMVLQPILKGVSGEISNVALDETNEELFDIEYNDEVNQIYISAQDISKLNTKTTYALNVSMTVGGVECKTVLKTKLSAKKPTVKIAGLTLPKANVAKADAAASLISTYKLGGKTFSIAPSAVKFMNGTAVEGEDGWFIDSKTNAKVHYDAENQVIEVKANDAEGAAAIKKGSVNIEISYAGLEKPVKKTLSIKVK
ncbi:MAG: hypothetical protein IJL55_05615 [Lachnospiraceae bacterium]|nr:hypothetical protein [Lachnospiraceae bacterium]